jgi:hypothetical protein
MAKQSSVDLAPVGGGGYKERVKEAECSGNIRYSCMTMEKMRHVEITKIASGGLKISYLYGEMRLEQQ